MTTLSSLKSIAFRLRYLMIVLLLIFKPVLADDPPFGEFNTPLDGSTVSGTISFTGWALDDIQVESLTLYYSTGSTYIYLAEAIFIEGSSPDVADAYPSYPNNTSAGWGYSFLSSFLSDDTYYIKAVAKDNNNNSTELGVKTITIDNASSTKPFGTLDLPTAGDIISGPNYLIRGWALTPQPNTIKTDGSTITIYIDGSPIGHPTYNVYRSDIASTFTGYTNTDGAGFYYYLDTTPYTDGLHSIHFIATDDAGNTEGLGSRYFYADNGNLPVELVSFSGTYLNDSVELNWQTATEVNNFGFEVQKSEASSQNSEESWDKIGFVYGKGTTNSPKDYEFTDSELPNSDLVKYRLKQIDNDGTFAYSKVVTVDLSNITNVDEEGLPTKYSLSQNYPNPFNPTTTIKFTIPTVGTSRDLSLHTKLAVYNMLGQQVTTLVNEQKAPGIYEVQFDGSNLSSGIYFYKLISGEYSQTRKLLLLK